jgi:anti-anti-sigma regulatory factor
MELLTDSNRTFKQDSTGAFILMNTEAKRTERNTYMLQMTRENVGELTVWHLTGHILRGQECTALLETITSQSSRRMLLDLSGVDSIDAAGLGTLVFLLHWSHEQNIELVFTDPSPPFCPSTTCVRPFTSSPPITTTPHNFS